MCFLEISFFEDVVFMFCLIMVNVSTRKFDSIVLINFHQVEYAGLPYPYPKVVLEVHLRRRYYYYLVNLVVPCSLIAVMVLLSFVLPPESGERVSLGITVLMAMAIFQELTSEKLPVESKFTPLLGMLKNIS